MACLRIEFVWGLGVVVKFKFEEKREEESGTEGYMWEGHGEKEEEGAEEREGWGERERERVWYAISA